MLVGVKPARWAEGVVVEHPGRPSATAVRWVRRVFDPLVRVNHRPTLSGVEHLPTKGAFLLVANHSAGLGIAEILSFVVLYLRQVGPDRPLAGFAHPIAFNVFPVSSMLRHIGAVPSTYDAAERALGAGVPLLVFPGGDHETLRPIWQAHRVDFGGRVGFLKIARRAGVPIVPLGIRGGHFTGPVLVRSRWLAWVFIWPRLVGVKRWGVSLLGVIGAAVILGLVPWEWHWRAALVWLWLGSPFVYLAFVPWTLRFRIGEPIPPSDLFPDGEGEDALGRALALVEERVQNLVRAQP